MSRARTPALYGRAAMMAPPMRTVSRATTNAGKLTFTGLLFCLCAIMIAMSAWSSLRIPIPLLHAHPYLTLMAPLCAFVCLTRIADFPTPTLVAMLAFTLVYTLAVLSGTPIYFQEIAKLWAGLATMLTAALSIRTLRDYRAGVVGLTLALLIMSLKGIVAPSGNFVGVDPLETGNENSWSLYNLPPLLLAGHMALDKSIKGWIRAFCGISTMVIAVAVLGSANRSGWLGLALIPFMLFSGRGQKMTSIIFVAIAGGLVYLVMEQFGMFDVLTHHVEQSAAGDTSDHKRVELLMTALQVGLENPLLGVSPQGLYFELAERVFAVRTYYDSHNMFATVVGGTGYMNLILLFTIFLLLWKRPRGVPSDFFGNQQAASAHYILRMMLLLWGVRAMFSSEMLYSPVFCAGVGVCIGWCLIEGVWKPADVQKRNVVGAAPLPTRMVMRRQPIPRRAW